MTSPQDGLTRRALLKISLALSGILGLGGILRFLSHREPPEAGHTFVLGPPDGYEPGSVTPLPHAHAFLQRDADGFFALSSLCTHLGCAINHEAGAFVCPCHGSQFTLEGLVLKGPALHPLRHLEVTLTDDHQLLLDTSVEVTRETRLVPGPGEERTTQPSESGERPRSTVSDWRSI